MSDAKTRNTVRCGTHGPRGTAVLCGHMLADTERVVGFVENSSDPANLQAWCDECERVFLAEGGMTPAFLELNAMTVVCDLCYARARQRHRRER